MRSFRRFFDRLAESDEARLSDEVRAWASSIPDVAPIAEAPRRDRVRIAGVVRRLTVFPMEGSEVLEALVTDGTGEVVVQFMGRRSIGGVGLGTRIVVEGVLGEHRGIVKMLNPRLELSA
jgi:RecG-like helicase